jgi:predicted nucleic acid-binding protein
MPGDHRPAGDEMIAFLRASAATPPAAATAHRSRDRRSVWRARRQAQESQRDPQVRINDPWLAAQAIQRNFKLLTSNPRDFKDILD